jgi:hypothetical protein
MTKKRTSSIVVYADSQLAQITWIIGRGQQYIMNDNVVYKVTEIKENKIELESAKTVLEISLESFCDNVKKFIPENVR